MKVLYLLRHAKSSTDIPGLTDFERPINDRGRLAAPAMAKKMKANGIRPALIISSPATRAITTARIVAEVLAYPIRQIRIREAIYEGWVDDLLSVLHEVEDHYDSVLMVGHNPGLQLLAEQLADFHEDKLPTCGLIGIRLNAKSWKMIEAGTGEVVMFDYPKKV